MKKILNTFKKSEVAIYAIAIMLVAAGYLNYTTMNNDSIETYSEEIANIGDAQLVNSDDVKKEENVSELNEEEAEKEEVNEVVADVINTNENDYFVNSKLERDTTYASMISNYTSIIEKDKASESEKKTAMQEITNINNIKNAIMISENVLSTKGFENSVIFVNDKSINVVVKVKERLSKEKVAQIQNIVSRELKAEISNIHITEK